MGCDFPIKGSSLWEAAVLLVMSYFTLKDTRTESKWTQMESQPVLNPSISCHRGVFFLIFINKAMCGGYILTENIIFNPTSDKMKRTDTQEKSWNNTFIICGRNQILNLHIRLIADFVMSDNDR